MINKKLLAVASVVTAIASSSAFAKTEGNYVGVDLLGTRAKTIDVVDGTGRKNNIDAGIGVNYKYAVNFDNFFIAPGVFYNYNNAEAKKGDVKSRLDYSYGVKADVGYDLTNQFATFVSFGFQENRNQDEIVGFGKERSTNEAYSYGVGVKYSLTKDVDAVLAYEYIDYKDSQTPNSFNPEVLRLGATYKF